MKLLKRYKTAAAIVLPVLILTVIRTFSVSGFKYDAKKWSEPSFNGSNIISLKGMDTLQGNRLIVNLDKDADRIHYPLASEVNVLPGEVLSRKFLRMFRDNKGPVILLSSDPALAARMWMVISQTGCRNILILETGNNNESFKSQFRPDTLTTPEL